MDRGGGRKGDMGRLSVIGGSRLYTGAAYFAARSAVRTGADLVYLHCDSSCSTSLKTLLPEAIVDSFDDINAASTTWPWLSSEIARPHVQTYLIGCGLGKENFAREVILRLVRLRSLSGVNIIIDGDALRHTLTPELFKWISENHQIHFYLTPNEKEYQHLSLLTDLENLPPHVCILRKGHIDRVYTCIGMKANDMVSQDEPAIRHPGGLGDMLAGILAAVVTMTHQNMKKLNINIPPADIPALLELNALMASRIMRRALDLAVFSEEGKRRHAYAHFIPQDVLDFVGFAAEEERLNQF